MSERHYPQSEDRAPYSEQERARLDIGTKAALIYERRFGRKRPDSLDKEQFAEGDKVRKAVGKLFDQIEEKHELEPAQIELLVSQLKANFTNNNRELPKLHPNAQWVHVEAALRARPDLMWSLSQMEETGGRVDVIEEDADTFLFGDTSRESPDGRRNVVFDKEAEQYATAGTFNGNADDKVKEWRVDFMDEKQYRALQERGNFDAKTWSWLKTPQHIQKAGDALDGSRAGEIVGVARGIAHSRDVVRGFRCALRVPKKA